MFLFMALWILNVFVNTLIEIIHPIIETVLNVIVIYLSLLGAVLANFNL
jgi:hypothetical protein